MALTGRGAEPSRRRELRRSVPRSDSRRWIDSVPIPNSARIQYLAAARADCLERLGRFADARDAFAEAAMLTENQVEREFLQSRIDQLS